MTQLQLRIGHSSSPCPSAGARVLQPVLPPAAEAPAALVRQALAHPIGSPTLAQIIRPGESVVIVTSDITRYTGSERAKEILENWTSERKKFVKVFPSEYRRALKELYVAAQAKPAVAA